MLKTVIACIFYAHKSIRTLLYNIKQNGYMKFSCNAFDLQMLLLPFSIILREGSNSFSYTEKCVIPPQPTWTLNFTKLKDTWKADYKFTYQEFFWNYCSLSCNILCCTITDDLHVCMSFKNFIRLDVLQPFTYYTLHIDDDFFIFYL